VSSAYAQAIIRAARGLAQPACPTGALWLRFRLFYRPAAAVYCEKVEDILRKNCNAGGYIEAIKGSHYAYISDTGVKAAPGQGYQI
jgi:hypothetical protein